jgi:hypothetical protein
MAAEANPSAWIRLAPEAPIEALDDHLVALAPAEKRVL